MTVTEQEFYSYVSAHGADDERNAGKDLTLARILVQDLIETDTWLDADIPAELIDQCIFDCGNALFLRRRTVGAPPQYTDFGKELPEPAALRDPLTAARALLRRYLKGGFA